MNYNKVNNILGWLCFAIATLTYILTLEPSSSFWDCGEFTAAAYKMQVVHQPGAPLFLMLQKLFSLLAMGNPMRIAYFMNVGSAVASGATILFLFWTITAMVRKMMLRSNNGQLSDYNMWLTMGAGVVGALAYTWSDSFWFSAVESEVYAQSSLATAVVVWGIMKWERHADEPHGDRWLLFLAYVMGLSIGVHLLNLLTIPALVFVVYFKRFKKHTTKGLLLTALTGIFILGIIQYGIIQYLVSFGAYFDLFFVNTLHMGFGTGVLVFALLLTGVLVWGIRYAIKKHNKVMHMAFLSTALIIFGYTSFAMIVIRAKADPPLNNSHPSDAFSLLSYLNREQYGDRPLLFGPNYNSQVTNATAGKNYYGKGEKNYVVTGQKMNYEYDSNSLLPRMYSRDGGHVDFYKEWMHLNDDSKVNLFDNIGFLTSYQIGYMYMRYFLWNFAGRQNDEQGQGSIYEGKWLTGIKPIDGIFLGNQSNLPPTVTQSKAHNTLFGLPLILGIIGAVFHFKRDRRYAGVVALLFFFTGIAIVLYLNQKPLEPRERDYAYVGSFYAFAIWIGFAVPAIASFARKWLSPKMAGVGAFIVCMLGGPIIMVAEEWDDHDRSTKLTAHDIAYDYLQSVAPNAILFTYGDNDTFPLWYIQEVEGVRPDVKLVNLSLFDTEWAINGLRKRTNQSDPLPIAMPASKYELGKREVMYFHDYKMSQPANLKDIYSLLLSDAPEDQVDLQGGGKANIFPTKHFYLDVNKQQVLSTGTVSGKMADSIPARMEFTWPSDYITKGNLAMIDILVHNDWKRPIYFTTTMPQSQFNGLGKYLWQEGLALRLLPVPNGSDGNSMETPLNTDVAYANVMNKFKWGNLKQARYIDPESRNDVFLFGEMLVQLANKLLDAGEMDKAQKVLNKYFEVIPLDVTYSSKMAINKERLAALLYRMGNKAKALEINRANLKDVAAQVRYFADVSESKNQLTGLAELQRSFYIFDLAIQDMRKYGQAADAAKYEAEFNTLQSRFSKYMQQ